MQKLTKFYQIIFTLKSGTRVEVCSEDEHTWIHKLPDSIIIHGFVWTPIYVAKVVTIRGEDVASIEVFDTPHLVWETQEGFQYGPSGSVGCGDTRTGEGHCG